MKVSAMRHDNDNGLKFISMFSGIEAASVAFTPLGWKAICLAEIDKNASTLLAYRYPEVPNVGDMSKHEWSQYRGKVDIVCGGPPCQAFSVAGLRDGLADSRGNLSLEYMRALHAIKPRNAIIENVPGWLTMSDNAFGCFLAGIVGADGPFVPVERKPAEGRSTRWWRWSEKEKVHAVCWPSYGMVSGPKGRAAWAVKDAQFFGLAQRRERVLVVADFGNGADPAAVLFERVSVPWNPPTRGEAREGVAHATAPSLTASGRGVERTGESRGQDPVIACANDVGALQAGDHKGVGNQFVDQGKVVAFGGNNTSGAIDVSTAVSTKHRDDFEAETFLVHAIQAGALRENPNSGPDGVGVQADVAYTMEARSEVQAVVYSMMPQNSGKDFKARPVEVAQPLMAAGPSHGNQGGDVVCVTVPVTHTLTTEGADASEDGTGRGTPIIAGTICKDSFSGGRPEGAAAGHFIPVCFTAKDYGGDAATDIAPTLRAGTHNSSHQNGGVTPAITVAIRGREGGATAELGGSDATALRASQGGGDKPHVLVDGLPDVAGTMKACRDSGGFSNSVDHAAGGYMVPTTTSAVRRLTPRECERLQGFPDDYTRIPVRKYATKKVTKNRPDDMWEFINGEWWLMAADGPRYKALGNSWAVPKFRWLGERIEWFMPPLTISANDNQPQAAKAAA